MNRDMPGRPMPLVLASSSPYRRALLERLGLPVSAASPEVDEASRAGESDRAYVARLALEKAHAVRGLYASGEAAFIGSDQCARLGGERLGKPGTVARNIEQLRASSSRTVTFFTSVAVIVGTRDEVRSAEVDVIPFRVRFRALGDEEIRRYVDRERPLDCAGGFKAEGLGISLFESTQGDDDTALIGLPLIRLSAMLRSIGFAVP